MAKKEEVVTAIIHVRQSWVETTGASAIFAAANVALGQGDILGIPVENEAVRSIKVLIPKKEVVLIVELKKPEGMVTLGYKAETSE